MQASQIPAKLVEAWAAKATSGYVRTVPQTDPGSGGASWDLGFPPSTFIASASGGYKPSGEDFNGALNADTAWAVWQACGGTVGYDATFSAAVGGYPSGAIIKAASGLGLWQSTADNNTSNPDNGGAGWTAMLPVTWAGNTGFDLPGFSLRTTTLIIPPGSSTQVISPPMPTLILQVTLTAGTQAGAANVSGTAVQNPSSTTTFTAFNGASGVAAVAVIAIGH